MKLIKKLMIAQIFGMVIIPIAVIIICKISKHKKCKYLEDKSSI